MQTLDWQQRAEDNERLRHAMQAELDSMKVAQTQLTADKAELLEMNYRLMEDRQLAADAIDALEFELAEAQQRLADSSTQVQQASSAPAMPPRVAALVNAYRRLPIPIRKGIHAATKPLTKGR